MFNEANREQLGPIQPDDVAEQPKLGFLAGIQASFDAQTRAHATMGIEAALQDEEQAQLERAQQAGVTLPSFKQLVPIRGSLAQQVDAGPGEYLAAARYFMDGDGGQPGVAEKFNRFDAAIEEAKKKNPELGLKTYREMFGEVQRKAKDAEKLSSRAGLVAGLIGGMAGSMDPRTDPLNAATLPLGGFGKTVGARIVSEGAVQGGIEAVNQITGVSEQRRLLGLETSVKDQIEDVLLTAAAGGAIRGIGEGVGAAAGRWFGGADAPPAPTSALPNLETKVATPEAPEASRTLRPMESFEDFAELLAEKPLGVSPLASERTRADASFVMRQLDNWDGPLPEELRPSTAAPPDIRTAQFTPLSDMRWRAPEDLAREVDPKTFSAFDKLASQKETLRGFLKEHDEGRTLVASAKVADLDARLAEFDRRLDRASPKNRKSIMAERETVQVERDAAFADVQSRDTPDMAGVRQRIMKLDEKMRDLAPLVSRAMDAGQARFRSEGMSADTMRVLGDLERLGGIRFRDADMPRGTVERPATRRVGAETAPAVPKTTETPQPRTVEEHAARSVELKAAEDKTLDTLSERLKTFRTEGGELITPGGRKIDLNETIVNDDGKEVSLRSLINDMDEDDTLLRAISTCSLGLASTTASAAS